MNYLVKALAAIALWSTLFYACLYHIFGHGIIILIIAIGIATAGISPAMLSCRKQRS